MRIRGNHNSWVQIYSYNISKFFSSKNQLYKYLYLQILKKGFVTLFFFLNVDEIRKKITSNYENILNEMQMTLAKETLSKCCGNTGMIKEKILPKYGNRKQRMSEFLRFILQDDHNVLEFEKMLKRNGLYELLLSEESVPEDQISNQDIGRSLCR